MSFSPPPPHTAPKMLPGCFPARGHRKYLSEQKHLPPHSRPLKERPRGSGCVRAVWELCRILLAVPPPCWHPCASMQVVPPKQTLPRPGKSFSRFTWRSLGKKEAADGPSQQPGSLLLVTNGIQTPSTAGKHPGAWGEGVSAKRLVPGAHCGPVARQRAWPGRPRCSPPPGRHPELSSQDSPLALCHQERAVASLQSALLPHRHLGTFLGHCPVRPLILPPLHTPTFYTSSVSVRPRKGEF